MAKLIPSNWNVVTITNLDKPDEQVFAYFNPKEITIEKKVPWNKHKKSKGDAPTLEFTNAEPETLSVELLFDTYEWKEDVYEWYIEPLRAMTLIDTKASGEKKRPPKVMLSWGDKKFLNFKGVITSLSVKYTMFLSDGTPCRATATISLQQAAKVKAKVKKKKKKTTPTGTDGSSSSSSSSSGTSGSTGA